MWKVNILVVIIISELSLLSIFIGNFHNDA